uniref:Uncharacterized protein n=2 Tax=Opuntia streptacantha TaxID=393608 RepID=A0A7C8YVC5_OPUST
MRDVQFFKQFNVAWIFSWEYRLQHFLPHPYPLSLVRILHNLHLFEKAKAPATPSNKDVKQEKSSSSSTKNKSRGLSQKERDLLEYLKDDPSMKQIVLQKILNKQINSDDETVSSAASSSPPKPWAAQSCSCRSEH